MPVAPQFSTVESIHICITPEIILHPCLLAFVPVFEKLGEFSDVVLVLYCHSFSYRCSMACIAVLLFLSMELAFVFLAYIAFRPMMVSRQVLLSAEV